MSAKENHWGEVIFFVGNVPFDCEETELRDVFVAAGCQISKVKIARDAESNRSRGFGFVTLLTDDAEAIVRELYGMDLDGRNLRIAISTSEPRTAA